MRNNDVCTYMKLGELHSVQRMYLTTFASELAFKYAKNLLLM